MADKDYAPLSASCARALGDKMYEKRKVAALEVERMVKEFASQNNTSQIRKLLKVLGQDFAMSHNPNGRMGGLIGMAATAIALGKESSLYVQDLVKPVLSCFYDPDSRVRYYGCESLYNIVKVARGSVLPYFNDIFDGLSKLAADPDQNVRSGSEVLDRLLKDIVTESTSFDLVAFIPLLRERVYTKNPFARQFLVSWVTVLDAVPDIDMLIFLPDILDGLFHILDDPNPEIRKRCESALGEFLNGIGRTPNKVDFKAMANILITHSQSKDIVIQYTAILWLKEFIMLSGRCMLPFTSGICSAILPCLSYDADSRKKIREAAKAVNNSLMRLISPQDDPVKDSSDAGKKIKNETSKQVNNLEGDVLDAQKGKLLLDVQSMVEVLTRQLLHDSMQTRIATLRWIYHLHIKTPNKIFKHVDELFPLLLKTLSDPSDEVVLLDLEVLAEISSSSAGQAVPSKLNTDPKMSKTLAMTGSNSMNVYFSKFLVSLLQLFSTDRQLLEDRGSFIIRQLCLLLNAEDIYRCCSEILLHEDDTKFASHMIQTLSTILLTSTELFELRTQLKDLKTEESCLLFSCLYKSWCHNPVATVALCLLTQNYQHAADLLHIFGDLEVTVEFLTEIDKLVQLIESPIFTYLRLQLLDIQHNQHLIKSLYSLLMLLPQSDAFRTLQHRLQCVPNIQVLPPEERLASHKKTQNRPAVQKINFKELLQHFKKVQERHRSAKRQPRTVDDLEATL